MKKTIMLIALVTVTFVSACSTAKGVAKDTYAVGKFVVRQVSSDE